MRRLFLLVVFWGPLPFVYIDPFYGTVLYAIINIIRPEQLMWGHASAVGRIFIAIQLVTFTSWMVNKNKLTPEFTKLPLQIKLCILMILEMIIIYFHALDQTFSWRWTDQFIKTVLFCFLLTKCINTAKKLELYYAVSVLWWVLLAIWGIQQKFGGNGRMEGLGGVVLSDINDLSAVYMLYIAVGYYSMFSKNRLIRIQGILSTIIFPVFIFLGGSRGAFLALAAMYAIIFLRAPGLQKIKTLFNMICMGALLMLVVITFIPSEFTEEYVQRLATMGGEEDTTSGEVEYESSAAGRLAIWRTAMHVYKNHSEYWFWGVGLRCFYRIYWDYHRDELEAYLEPHELAAVSRGGRGGKQMHNTLLNILLGGGLLLLVTYLILLIHSILQMHYFPKKYPQIVDGVDIHNYARGIEVGLIGFSIAALFITEEFIDFFYWTVTLAAVVNNLGKGGLKRIESGQEDEEFME